MFTTNSIRHMLPPLTPKLVPKGRDPFDQNLRKYRSKTQSIGSVQPDKVRKNWSTYLGGILFPGRTGRNCSWMDRAQDLQARKRNSAVSSARDASGYEIKKKISERKWLLRRIGSSLLPSPLQFYISYIHGLGKVLNLRDISMVAVRDFTKFRFLPPLSTD